MSAALNALGESSRNDSLGTHPDLSLGGSFNVSIPGRASRVASTSSSALPPPGTFATPSPPKTNLPFSRKTSTADGPGPKFRRMFSNVSQLSHQAEDDGGVLNTPEHEKRKWDPASVPEPTTPRPGASRSTTAKPGPSGPKVPTLRDQEKQIDNLKKENFDLKLKLHFLEERLAQLAPDQVKQALDQNINLKVEVQARGREVKKMKKRQTELEKALDVGNEERTALQRELRELERRLSSWEGGRRHDEREEEIQELQLRNEELAADMEEMGNLMQEHVEEKERLQDLLAQQQPASRNANMSMVSEGGERRSKERIARLEAELEQLRDEAQQELEDARIREDDLIDEVNGLKTSIEALERRREAENMERSESRSMMLEEREAREDLEEGYNAARDKLAAMQLELQDSEDALAQKDQDIDQIVQQHNAILAENDANWQEEIQQAREQAEQLQDTLAEREGDCNELEAQLREMQQIVEEVASEIQAKDRELLETNEDLKRYVDQTRHLEEDIDRMQAEYERAQAEMQDEHERLHAVNEALKEKRSDLEEHIQQLDDQHQQALQEIEEHRGRQEELAKHIEELVSELNAENDARKRVERALEEAEAAHTDALRRERRTLENKESALQSTLTDLARVEATLAQRETDLQAVQEALTALEADARREGDNHTSAKFSLQLELDRLIRDNERLEDDLKRSRRERDDHDDGRRDRDTQLDRLHAENRDLAAQLAAQTQARLNMSEKLDGVQSSLSTAETERNSLREKLKTLEGRLSKEQRELRNADQMHRDQLTERNTLLLTIYQYMDRILGPDKAKKSETKPFTNFGVFNDLILGRLKTLSQVQTDFDKRVKDTEARYVEKLNDLRKQLDNRWKQLDKFEASVKILTEAKATWRRKLSAKEGELEAIKQSNSDLAAQLSSTRRPGGADPMEIRSLTNRATNAERRLTNAQNQLAMAEERIATMNQKTTAVDSRWEARVKEYEDRLKKAEEQYKRERQGSKESQAAYETQIKSLNRQKELADKRNAQLQDMLKTTNVESPRR